MEGVDSVHWMLSVEGRRDGNMDWREGILERPEHVLLFGEGKVGCRHSVERGTSWWQVVSAGAGGHGGKGWLQEGQPAL